MRKITLLTGLFLMTIGLAKAQTPNTNGVIYVKQDATGSGKSWSDAYGNLQEAIDAANVKEVWVAKGEYQPTTTGDYFSMKKGVKIYGAFPNSGSPTMADRDFSTNETILKGNGGSVIRNVQNNLTPENALLDGFTIRDGNNSNNDGGGILNIDTSPALTNLIISRNKSNTGGGIFNSSSSPTLTNVTISKNNGTGVFNTSNSSPILTNVTISENTANGAGGGIYNSNSSPTLTNVSISKNKANVGGGMYNSNSSPILTNVTLNENKTVDGRGGGIYNSNSSPTLTNVTITKNTTNFGGGIYNDNSSPILNDVTIDENTANEGGAMANENNSSPILENTIISKNTTLRGGGIYNKNSSPILTDVTITENSAEYHGGGIYNVNSTVTLFNTTINKNRVNFDYGGGIYNDNLSTTTLTNGTISENYAEKNGGGVNNDGGTLILTDVIINKNSGSIGGGIYNFEGDMTLTNVTISNNTGEIGGGIYNYNAITSDLTNATISNNEADKGGGVYTSESHFRMKGGAIIDNKSLFSNGGGLYNDGPSLLTLTDIIIKGNSAAINGGGIYTKGGGTTHIFNTAISNNTATENGGGIYFENNNTSLYATNVLLNGNHAGIQGGGLYNYKASALLTNLTIADNTADMDGGAITNISAQDVRMNNCIVLGNSSGIETDYDIEDSKYNLVQTGGATSDAKLDGVTVGNSTPNEIFNRNNTPTLPYYSLLTAPNNPAIDGGSNYAYTDIAAYFLEDLDLYGHPRLCGDSIDIGAYEGGITATHTITGDNNVCANASIQLSSSTTGGIWSVNANATIDSNGKLTGKNAGTADVIYKTINNGCVNIATHTVTIKPAPTVAINAVNDENTLCKNATAVVLTGTPANGTFSGNGVVGNSFRPVVAGVGSHTITYTYTDNENCTAKATATIKVVDCVGLEEANVNLLTVYPNPSNTGLFTLSITGEELNQEEVLIYNALGQHIQSFILHDKQQTIDLTNQAKGVYILKVGTQTVRLVKK